MLNKPNITSVTDFKVLINSVAAVTQQNVNNESMNIALGILEKSTEKLQNLTGARNIGVEGLEQAMKPSFATLSNLLIEGEESMHFS